MKESFQILTLSLLKIEVTFYIRKQKSISILLNFTQIFFFLKATLIKNIKILFFVFSTVSIVNT